MRHQFDRGTHYDSPVTFESDASHVFVRLPVFSSCSCGASIRLMLFQHPHEEPSDEEIAEVLLQAIAQAGTLPRHADIFLAGICAEYLVNGLRAAGLIVARPMQWPMHR